MNTSVNSAAGAAFKPAVPSSVVYRRIINLIFVVYWLLIFEGALRKWVAPQFEEILFFIRVPLVSLVYALALYHHQWPRTNGPLLSTYIFAAVAVVLAFLQIIVGGYDFRYLLLTGYGWINYFFYIPLAFIIAEQFRREDIRRLIHHTLWISVMAGLLVISQYAEPANSIINQGSGIIEEHQFHNLGSGLGSVRPFGFFTSTLGQQMFVSSVFALLLPMWLVPKNAILVGRKLLFAGTLAGLLMLILSQSRGLFFNVTLIFLAAAAGAWLTGTKRILLRVAFVPAMLITFAIAIWIFVFPMAFEAFTERALGAWAVETEYFQFGVFGRAFHVFYGFIDYLPDTPLIGYLLGLGGNAASQLAWVSPPEVASHWMGPISWGEGGWERHIIELGPILGIVYIIFRIGLTLWLGRLVVRVTRRSKNVIAIVIFGYSGTLLLVMQITGHGTVNGYTWMFFGFCAAAARLWDNRPGDGGKPNTGLRLSRNLRHTLAPLPPDRKRFLPIQALDLLVVHLAAPPAKQDVEPPVAEARTLGCELHQALTDLAIASGTRPVTTARR